MRMPSSACRRPAAGRARAALPGAATVELVDLDAEALQQRLLEQELQPRPVRRVGHAAELGGCVRQLVVGAERDAGHAAGRQRLEDAGAERRPLSPFWKFCRTVPIGLVGLAPRHAGDPAGVELGQRRLDVGAGDGRVEGQHADGVGAADEAAVELHQVVVGDAGEQRGSGCRCCPAPGRWRSPRPATCGATGGPCRCTVIGVGVLPRRAMIDWCGSVSRSGGMTSRLLGQQLLNVGLGHEALLPATARPAASSATAASPRSSASCSPPHWPSPRPARPTPDRAEDKVSGLVSAVPVRKLLRPFAGGTANRADS